MPDFSNLCGWKPNPRAVEAVLNSAPRAIFGVSGNHLKGSGRGKSKFWHPEITHTVGGKFPLLVQGIGDCVGFGSIGALHQVIVSDIRKHGDRERWAGQLATEIPYAHGRVEIGGGQFRDDGSTVAWTVKSLRDGGSLLRKKYGRYDLSEYNPNRARDWGRPGKGVPDVLEPEMHKHRIGDFSMLTSFAQLCDALWNGHGCILTSMWAFKSQRDKNGFLVRDRRNSWPHCWYTHGYSDEDGKPFLLLQNSWPASWISGPHGSGIKLPPGCGKLRADDFADFIDDYWDSWVISRISGFPELDWSAW